MANPSSSDWLEPPLWWKKWRPLRWLAGAIVLAGVYAWLAPLLTSEDAPPQQTAGTTAPSTPPAVEAPAPAAETAPEPVAEPPVQETAPPPAAAQQPEPAAKKEQAVAVPPPAEAFIYEESGPEAPATDSEIAAFTRVESDPVKLLGSYRSYIGVDEVVYGLEHAGFKPLVESRHAAVADDAPPRNLDVVVVHQFRHWGVQGRLELQFFNDRLYQTEFEPEEPELYLAAQRRELPQLKRERSGRSELIDGNLRIASSLDLAVSEVGRKLHTRPFMLWQDRRLVRQRDEWDRRFRTAAAR